MGELNMGDTRLLTRVMCAALAVVMLTVGLAAAGPSRLGSPAGAQANKTVSISEIHYNPASVGETFPDYDDRADAEFIEIANWGDALVDIGGWCLSDAIDFCFDPGTILGAGDVLVGARDSQVLNQVAGVAADFDYDGKLANSDETIVISDSAGAVVEQVDYDSRGLWPITPDGLGPSLERVGFGSAEVGPRAWKASSANGGTPGVAALGVGPLPPLVTDHAAPPNPPAGQGATVTATITGASGATLEYLVNFRAVQQLAMTEANGTWSATVPGADAGDLVRYRVQASGPGGTQRGPRVDDSINWWGYVVADGINTQVEELQWFATDADYNAVYGNPRSNTPCDGGLCPAVVALGGKVWDSVGFRAAGLTSRGHAKKNFRIDFPHGHPFEAEFLGGPVDVITLDAQSPNYEQIREKISWEIMVEQDMPVIHTGHAHVRKNGEFFGLYLMREEQDGRWRSAQGFDEGSYYKFEGFGAKQGWHGTWQKLEGHDVDDSLLAELRDCVNAARADRRVCLPQQVDLPQLVNELAAITLTGQWDQREFNWHIWHDTTGTDLWQLFPDDLDRSWGGNLTNPVATSDFTIRRCFGLDGTPGNEVCTAIMDVPEFEAMVYRRLRTMADTTLDGERWPNRIQELRGLIAADWELDEGLHNRTSVDLDVAATALAGFARNYTDYLQAGGYQGKVPAAQAAAPPMAIGEIRLNRGDGLEYVVLQNPSADTYIDMSDWQIAGLSPLPKGSVIPPNGELVAVVDEVAFSAIAGNDQRLRAQVDGGVGPVARLSRADGSFVVEAGEFPDSPVHLNEWNAVDPDRAIAGGDLFFGQVDGNGGDWFELVVARDHTDMRGWSFLLSDEADDVRGLRDVLVFTDDPALADLRSGTIVTIAESVADDLSYDPLNGDWTINFQSTSDGAGAFFTADSQENFDTNAASWQLAILDSDGNIVFGPAGEGAGGVSGVNGAEVGELDADPGPGITPESGFDDGDSSTFGSPNESAGVLQNFAPLRLWFGDADRSGVIDVADVQALLDDGTGLAPLASRGPGDVNLDGTADLLDALMLAQRLAG